MGKARQGRVNSLGLATLNTFLRFWTIGVISSCLVSGPGIIKAEKFCLLACISQIEEAWFRIGSFAN